MGFNYLKATVYFYYYVPRGSWYSIDWPRKDERLSQP